MSCQGPNAQVGVPSSAASSLRRWPVTPQAWQNWAKALLRVLQAVQWSNKPMPQCGQKLMSGCFRSTVRSHPGHTPLASRVSAVS